MIPFRIILLWQGIHLHLRRTCSMPTPYHVLYWESNPNLRKQRFSIPNDLFNDGEANDLSNVNDFYEYGPLIKTGQFLGTIRSPFRSRLTRITLLFSSSQ